MSKVASASKNSVLSLVLSLWINAKFCTISMPGRKKNMLVHYTYNGDLINLPLRDNDTPSEKPDQPSLLTTANDTLMISQPNLRRSKLRLGSGYNI